MRQIPPKNESRRKSDVPVGLRSARPSLGRRQGHGTILGVSRFTAEASEEHDMQKITTCLWFDGQAEEAMNHYVSIFKNSKVLSVLRWPKGHANEGKVLMTTFELDGVPFQALNGGPQFKFNEAMSQSIDCKTQEEVDYFWEKLTEGGEPGVCSWLKDKFGVSWQVVPEQLPRLLLDPDRAKAGRVMSAMMQMGKIDIAKIEAAAKG
jgi:predicted 3-demethylubiquinone-9 3-methyltransferase (glyoxalase superfamily)